MNRCFFCKYDFEPDYKDIENLEKFLTPRKKIVSRERSGVCAKHERTLSKQIKYARFLALIPYTSYQGEI
ncbi:30S ribosomal protein S18 [Candidatus Roizmanbacteria bacterium RIFCSPLOWO2_01_FULL_38_12]|uniref:Small ribosomal subunit protein bS18 n=1 Tax=Candidatus Roizmanbacteria bacterium RIFCSPLOWO2_01_FULL_38_12 TaxID=1802061 RepID=A0A1F7ITY9_9BACT|nr:MAG: 30S ribosomal protein S18 [Candidatus Roizmanbacteria bacterium RIFCSPHIGHO2_01_FULL_38_15]OGK34844.1 MAG: 30S ribosomal protein S18 [Candidatus Roizmanbacteria bacterium RIFCSPHIGHO2_12_FULL_38_13]OGK46829.1 MAG: 30S ribosomal protein S18 [Candidatus Roizmanbacteria bacterium RIFCSPLOWO2_01_FULL_38_12]